FSGDSKQTPRISQTHTRPSLLLTPGICPGGARVGVAAQFPSLQSFWQVRWRAAVKRAAFCIPLRASPLQTLVVLLWAILAVFASDGYEAFAGSLLPIKAKVQGGEVSR